MMMLGPAVASQRAATRSAICKSVWGRRSGMGFIMLILARENSAGKEALTPGGPDRRLQTQMRHGRDRRCRIRIAQH
jgi:hypothetical protein